MSDLVIRAVGLSKRYRIGRRQRYRNLRDALAGAFARQRRADRAPAISAPCGHSLAGADGHFWALRDVSFEVQRGDVVGIVGANGAGKSTLLKILARITRPTAGYADVTGRVGTLLELGTGFNSELSGRENIYLSGAMLGMQKRDIDRRFDQIVAFAEIDEFLDTAVKHYSNGMFVRTAFAVAAHLEAEILLVDEVLAVGDVAFQARCLDKIRELSRCGRTILFVSHNMAAVNALCRTTLLFEHGTLARAADSTSVTEAHVAQQLRAAHHDAPPAGEPHALTAAK